MALIGEISTLLQQGRAPQVKELVKKAIDEGYDVKEILSDGLLDGMNKIGEKFRKNKVFVPEVLIAARAMNYGMEVLKPMLVEKGVKSAGRACIGTVKGDLHDIGKNLVKMMLEGKGIEVIDLGTDVEAQTFIKAAIENDCELICCSALLTTTMNAMKEVVDAAQEAGIRDKVKILIGGAPISQDYCEKIGADIYAADAASAADEAFAGLIANKTE